MASFGSMLILQQLMATYFTDVRSLGLCAGLFLLGVAGLQAQTPDPTDTTYVTFVTTLGSIDVQMLTKEAHGNVTNFLNYVNSGAYNNTFFHRAIPGFIIQGGGFYFANGGALTAVTPNAPVNGQPGFLNKRGTLAMALQTVDVVNGGDSEDTGTTNWFFNLADNPSLDSAQNVTDTTNGLPAISGPFTVFGVVANSSSLAVMDSISAVQTWPFSSPFDTLPLLNYNQTLFNQGSIPFADFLYTTSFTTYTLANLSSWQAAFASDPNAATDSLPAAVPQHDDTPNLVKYALGITGNQTMTAIDRAKLPVVGKAAGTGHMTLTYHQRMHLAVVGVTVGVLVSTDLVNWAPPDNATTTQTGVDSDGNAIMVVDVPAPASGSEFIRLSVTQQ